MSFRTIEEELARSGRAVSYTVGTSMEPMLHERRSTVVIEPARHPLCRGDVALFRRPDDTYVLHRVVGALDDGYLMRGDNQTVPSVCRSSGCWACWPATMPTSGTNTPPAAVLPTLPTAGRYLTDMRGSGCVPSPDELKANCGGCWGMLNDSWTILLFSCTTKGGNPYDIP